MWSAQFHKVSKHYSWPPLPEVADIPKKTASPSTTHLSGLIFEEESFNIDYLCGGGMCVCHGLVEIKGQLAASSSLLPPGTELRPSGFVAGTTTPSQEAPGMLLK